MFLHCSRQFHHRTHNGGVLGKAKDRFDEVKRSVYVQGKVKPTNRRHRVDCIVEMRATQYMKLEVGPAMTSSL